MLIPNELWSLIFSFVESQATKYQIIMVCTRFEHLMGPLLYERPEIQGVLKAVLFYESMGGRIISGRRHSFDEFSGPLSRRGLRLLELVKDLTKVDCSTSFIKFLVNHCPNISALPPFIWLFGSDVAFEIVQQLAPKLVHLEMKRSNQEHLLELYRRLERTNRRWSGGTVLKHCDDPYTQELLSSLLPSDSRLASLFFYFPKISDLVFDARASTANPETLLNMACYLYPHLKRLQLRNVTLERDCLTKVLAQWQELGICKFVQFKIDDVFSNLPVRLKRLSLNECTIDDHSPIQRLHLDTLSITHSTLLGNVRQWLPPGLRCVQIRDNHTVDNSQYQTAFRINQQDTEWILFLSKIRHVDLDCASLDMEPLGMHCLRLRGLRLSIDHLTDEHLLAFLKAPLMLKRLEITSCDCHLTSVTLQGLSTHATLKQTLEYLNLSGEFTWHRGIELLLDITNLKQMYFPCLDSKTVQSTLETALEGIKIESQMNPVFL